MKNVFFLLIVAIKVFFSVNLLHASCNQSTDPNVFKIHGTEKQKAVIEGECLNELFKAIGEGKDIDIWNAEIRGNIDFSKSEFFPTHSLEKVKEKALLNLDEIAYAKHIKEKLFITQEKIVLVNGKIEITYSLIKGNVVTNPNIGSPEIIIFFKNGVNFFNTWFAGWVDFGFAQFNGTTNFASAEFFGPTYFGGTVFDDNAIFGSARFAKQPATFRDAQFNGMADFMDARFEGEANFMYALFAGWTTFWFAQFADCSFESAIFGIKSKYTRDYLNRKNILKIIAKETNTNFDDINSLQWRAGIGLYQNKFFIFFPQEDEKKVFLSPRTTKLIHAYRTAINEKYLREMKIDSLPAKDILPEKEILTITKTSLARLPPHLKFPDDLKKMIDFDPLQQILIFKGVMSEEEQEKLLKTSQDNAYEYERAIKKLFEWSNAKIYFENVTFSKFANFRNAIFLCDINFQDAKFKEVGAFDECFFFNVKELGLIEEENADSVIDLNMDNAYFNLLKGLSFDQIFPHLNKRMKFDKIKDTGERQNIINNCIYLQENFRKIGRFDDADKIYYERKVLESKKEKGLWNKTWNWILDITCRYGTNFKQIVFVCGVIILLFTILYFLTFFRWVQIHLGTIEFKNKELDRRYHFLKALCLSCYLSLNTFITRGTGDIITTRFFRMLVVVEGGLGWLMLSLFIVVLARQYFR